MWPHFVCPIRALGVILIIFMSSTIPVLSVLRNFPCRICWSLSTCLKAYSCRPAASLCVVQTKSLVPWRGRWAARDFWPIMESQGPEKISFSKHVYAQICAGNQRTNVSRTNHDSLELTINSQTGLEKCNVCTHVLWNRSEEFKCAYKYYAKNLCNY